MIGRSPRAAPSAAAACHLARSAIVALTILLAAACTTQGPPEPLPEPLAAERVLDLEVMPPVYELVTPSPAMQSMLGLRPSEETINARIIPPRLRESDFSVPHDLFQTGQASWYGDRFHGRLTANGERYDMHAMTAAHRTLPFGTMVCVRGLLTGKEVLVRINDRGPYSGRRIIDLSRRAAEELGMLAQGIKQVALWIPDEDSPPCGNGNVILHGKGEPPPRNGKG
ncbi:septal ring lytic transglycosylase RlpA family protein [Lampropedia cohaerens]|uniref:septal ring lytic transglycosylase RlpA family protein n=1 Tax=Lampropedia cohaerens TaxID=1610491 RepID=UPI000699F53D|nr:septal ring lytic transglycosylase RlpA family protein [Lampropedia cohaerens]